MEFTREIGLSSSLQPFNLPNFFTMILPFWPSFHYFFPYILIFFLIFFLLFFLHLSFFLSFSFPFFLSFLHLFLIALPFYLFLFYLHVSYLLLPASQNRFCCSILNLLESLHSWTNRWKIERRARGGEGVCACKGKLQSIENGSTQDAFYHSVEALEEGGTK